MMMMISTPKTVNSPTPSTIQVHSSSTWTPPPLVHVFAASEVNQLSRQRFLRFFYKKFRDNDFTITKLATALNPRSSPSSAIWLNWWWMIHMNTHFTPLSQSHTTINAEVVNQIFSRFLLLLLMYVGRTKALAQVLAYRNRSRRRRKRLKSLWERS